MNEEVSIGPVIEGLKITLQSYDHDIVVVDGGSTDKTQEIVQKKGAILLRQRGSGYGDALYNGFRFAVGELDAGMIVMMDGDGTYSPSDVSKLMAPIFEQSAYVVVGKRLPRRGAMTLTRRAGNWLISWLIRKLLGVNVSDTQSGMFAFRSELVGRIDGVVRGWAFNTEILKEAEEAGMIIREIPIIYSPRTAGKSSSAIRGGISNITVILRLMRDYEPLLFFGGLGFLIAFLGFLLGVSVVLMEWWTHGYVIHVASTVASSVLVLGGILLFAIGLLADMIKDIKKKLKVKI